MSRKHQIFKPITFQDLRDERDQVIKAVLEMGHIPVGMEMFSAADEEQWAIIARQIDERTTTFSLVVIGTGVQQRKVSAIRRRSTTTQCRSPTFPRIGSTTQHLGQRTSTRLTQRAKSGLPTQEEGENAPLQF